MASRKIHLLLTGSLFVLSSFSDEITMFFKIIHMYSIANVDINKHILKRDIMNTYFVCSSQYHVKPKLGCIVLWFEDVNFPQNGTRCVRLNVLNFQISCNNPHCFSYSYHALHFTIPLSKYSFAVACLKVVWNILELNELVVTWFWHCTRSRNKTL